MVDPYDHDQHRHFLVQVHLDRTRQCQPKLRHIFRARQQMLDSDYQMLWPNDALNTVYVIYFVTFWSCSVNKLAP